MAKSTLSYFRGSLFLTVIGLAAGAGVGLLYSGTWEGALSALFLTAVLGVLEVSLSFDNAVVNASVLGTMTPVWRHRFITWGILIAVFGMRIVFPLAIVSVMASLDPWSALVLAATRPHEYAELMQSAHIGLAGFGGSFLLLVCLDYFFDEDKDVHWLSWIEKPLAKVGKISAVETAIALAVAYVISNFLHDSDARISFLLASIGGIVTFVLVDGIGTLLQAPRGAQKNLHRASAAMFVYLEILDASFSFDGVIGAFALTQNLFIIALGLGIGAMFVRSMTILLVEKRTLDQFRYLEHGAFYAIGALAAVMFIDLFLPVPEVVTGLLGAALIGLSLYSSRRKGAHHV
jgi:hypothetical protein